FSPTVNSDYYTLASLTLGVSAGSTVQVQRRPFNFAPTYSWAVNGVDDNNTLVGPDKTNTWQITGPDSGTLDDPLTYTGFNNLTGGAGSDTFAFGTNGTVSGVLDGGAGVDFLDYSNHSGTVAVDLKAGQATGVTVPGNLHNVEKVHDITITPPGDQS